MGLTYQGELTLGAIFPAISAQFAADIVFDTAQLLNLNLGLTALLNLQISPPTIAFSIGLVGQILANLQLALSIGVPNITVGFDASIIASIEASIAALQITLNLLLAIQANFTTAGVFAYTYSGSGAALGGTLTSNLATQWPDGSPSSTSGTAIILAAVAPAASASMAAVFSGL